MRREPTDEKLLTSGDPEQFGVFYARHLPDVEAYFARRLGRDVAADLAAETFASALVARRRFVPSETPAVGWLYTIAARRLVDFQRRTIVRQRTLDALAGEAAVPHDPSAEWSSATDLEVGPLRHLPRDQRRAIVAHLADDRTYRQIAVEHCTPEATIRQRVSRGLSTVRRPFEVYRAAHAVAAQAREYRFGGGHGKPLSSIGARDALDCASSTCLILLQSALFEPGPAWLSHRLAENWGQLGEGRYVTLWANEEHVWLEFKLDSDHGERFDPTPLRSRPSNAWLSRLAGPTRDFVPRHWPGL
jgi:RNA polymerase sigma-70 factor (ECF subfamily)